MDKNKSDQLNKLRSWKSCQIFIEVRADFCVAWIRIVDFDRPEAVGFGWDYASALEDCLAQYERRDRRIDEIRAR